MAATAVYFRIVRLPEGGTYATEVVTFDNIAATTAAFTLLGGRYVATTVGATFGTVTIQALGEDGTTYLTAATAIAANGVTPALDLPRGTYRLAIA